MYDTYVNSMTTIQLKTGKLLIEYRFLKKLYKYHTMFDTQQFFSSQNNFVACN